jgi:hypothetical protein
MKHITLSLSLLLGVLFAGAQIKPYHTTGLGMNFSYALTDDTQNGNVIPRFTFLYNMNNNYHFDFAEHFGMYAGYSIGNVGFISEWNDSLQTKKKFRTYNIGVPIGFKVGNLDPKEPFYFFFGGAMEIPFHFKEKTFYDGKKDGKIKEWGSNRVNILQPNLFVGITFPNKNTLKFSYYPMDFLNNSYTENINGTQVRPYSNFLHSNIVLITYGAGLTNVKKK